MASSNLVLSADSYKYSHWKQTPPDTTGGFHYYYSRGGAFPYSIWFGLQHKLLSRFQRPITRQDVCEAQEVIDAHMGPGVFYRAGWEHIVSAHRGYIPMLIKAVPEGTRVPTHNCLMTVESTCSFCYWVPAFFETQLSHVWYGTTVATKSHQIKELIRRFLIQTEGNDEGLEFKLHDFGFRGVSSDESAGIGGAAHLVNFRGTDTLQALLTARDYYGADLRAGHIPANSIPAAEHYTITSWGQGQEAEARAFDHITNTAFPTGLVAVVSDTNDIYAACEHIWGGTLRDKVLARKGTIVVRPDSGEPRIVVAAVVDMLARKFADYCTVSLKGYKRLPEQISVIQGDGIDFHPINEILMAVAAKGYSARNVSFGMGGALLQKVDRDTLNFKYAASAIQRNGEWHPICKNPRTASWKASTPGRLKLVKDYNGILHTVTEDDPRPNQLVQRYYNGEICRDNFENIRLRAANG